MYTAVGMRQAIVIDDDDDEDAAPVAARLSGYIREECICPRDSVFEVREGMSGKGLL